MNSTPKTLEQARQESEIIRRAALDMQRLEQDHQARKRRNDLKFHGMMWLLVGAILLVVFGPVLFRLFQK